MRESTKQKILSAFEDRHNWVHGLAKRSGFSENTVRKYLKILLEEKAIRRSNISVSYTPSWVYMLPETVERIEKEMRRIKGC